MLPIVNPREDPLCVCMCVGRPSIDKILQDVNASVVVRVRHLPSPGLSRALLSWLSNSAVSRFQGFKVCACVYLNMHAHAREQGRKIKQWDRSQNT